MKKVITIMNAEEVIGSIAHLLRSDYMDLLFKIEEGIEKEKTLSEIVGDYCDNPGIFNFHKLSPDEKAFLQIFDSENYFISTFGDEYCETI